MADRSAYRDGLLAAMGGESRSRRSGTRTRVAQALTPSQVDAGGIGVSLPKPRPSSGYRFTLPGETAPASAAAPSAGARVRSLESSRMFSTMVRRQQERRAARELANAARVTGQTQAYRLAREAERSIAVPAAAAPLAGAIAAPGAAVPEAQEGHLGGQLQAQPQAQPDRVQGGPARVWVQPYTRADGKRVEGYWRINPRPAEPYDPTGPIETPLMSAAQAYFTAYGPDGRPAAPLEPQGPAFTRRLSGVLSDVLGPFANFARPTYEALGPAINIDGLTYYRGPDGELIEADPRTDILGRSDGQVYRRQSRPPFPEAAQYAQRVGIAGKVLGAIGLDASGERAATTWAQAWENTQKGASLLNTLHSGLEAFQRGLTEQYPADSPIPGQLAMEAAGTLIVTGAPFAPRGAVGSAGGRPPIRLSPAADLNELGLYSRLMRAARQMRERGTPQEMLAELTRLAGGPESRAVTEEMRWTGVRQMLEDRAAAARRPGSNEPKTVTRDEIVQHLQQNHVRITGRLLEGETPGRVHLTDLLNDETRAGRRELMFGVDTEAGDQMVSASISATGQSVRFIPDHGMPFRVMIPEDVRKAMATDRNAISGFLEDQLQGRMLDPEMGPHFGPIRHPGYNLAPVTNASYAEQIFQLQRPGEAQSLANIEALENASSRAGTASGAKLADAAVEAAIAAYEQRFPRLLGPYEYGAHHARYFPSLVGGHVRTVELPVQTGDGRWLTAHHIEEHQNDLAQAYRKAEVPKLDERIQQVIGDIDVTQLERNAAIDEAHKYLRDWLVQAEQHARLVEEQGRGISRTEREAIARVRNLDRSLAADQSPDAVYNVILDAVERVHHEQARANGSSVNASNTEAYGHLDNLRTTNFDLTEARNQLAKLERQRARNPDAPLITGTPSWLDFQLSTQLIQAARNPRAEAMTVIGGEEIARRFGQIRVEAARFEYDPATGQVRRNGTHWGYIPVGNLRDRIFGTMPAEQGEAIRAAVVRAVGEHPERYREAGRYVTIDTPRVYLPAGRGNVEFYNTIVRRRLGAILRRVDRDARIETGTIATNSPGASQTRAVPVTMVEMTPQLRQRLLTEGLPIMVNPPTDAVAAAVAAAPGQRERLARERTRALREVMARVRARRY